MLADKNISFASANEAEVAEVEASLEACIFVIPSINGGALLAQMLPTLGIPGGSILVLDQGSTDTTKQVCAEHGVELLQLGKPHTYTQCCNIAVQQAKARGCEFFFISNNDITFVTDVARELVHEMLQDRSLGALSCSQVITGSAERLGVLSNRVAWDLSATDFEHDLTVPQGDVYRIESDFCELTCAIIRTAAADAIGGFDDDFGFYHEDADFGLRLREAGYATAYLPQSQIKHFQGSTFSQGKAEARMEYIKNSRRLFTEKHLGYGLGYVDHRNDIATSWNIINQNLYPYMKRYGLIDDQQPELIFNHPGIRDDNVLYTVWETSKLPKEWLQYGDNYPATYVPSMWNFRVFEEAGFQRLHYVPLGVETDVFQPWGTIERQYDGPTFLWFARAQFRKGYDVILRAWQDFRETHPDATLIMLGHGVLPEGSENRLKARQWRQFLIHDDAEQGISYRETLVPLKNEELATLYRSVDYLVLTSRSEGFGFSVVEAMACGTLAIFSNYGATTDMVYEDAITFDAKEVPADYGDKDFYEVGTWWEPDPLAVSAAMARAMALDAAERKRHLRRGLNLVRSKFTWRNTCFAIRADLKSWQTKKSIPYAYNPQVQAQSESIPDFISRIQASKREASVPPPSLIDIESAFREFDREFYLASYRDIRELGIDPLSHYIFYGAMEGRRAPSAFFSTISYVAADPLVRNILAGLHELGSAYDPTEVRAAIAAWQTDMLGRYAEMPDTTDAAFIDAVYKIVLNRPPDASGSAHYEKLLGGRTEARKRLIKQMFASSERARVFPFWASHHMPLVTPIGEQPAQPRAKSWFKRK